MGSLSVENRPKWDKGRKRALGGVCDNPGKTGCGLNPSNGRGVGEEGYDFKFTSKVKMKAFAV